MNSLLGLFGRKNCNLDKEMQNISSLMTVKTISLFSHTEFDPEEEAIRLAKRSKVILEDMSWNKDATNDDFMNLVLCLLTLPPKCAYYLIIKYATYDGSSDTTRISQVMGFIVYVLTLDIEFTPDDFVGHNMSQLVQYLLLNKSHRVEQTTDLIVTSIFMGINSVGKARSIYQSYKIESEIFQTKIYEKMVVIAGEEIANAIAKK